MSARKVHRISDRRIAGLRVTACNAYMAEGDDAANVTDNPNKVTCLACQKADQRGAVNP